MGFLVLIQNQRGISASITLGVRAVETPISAVIEGIFQIPLGVGIITDMRPAVGVHRYGRIHSRSNVGIHCSVPPVVPVKIRILKFIFGLIDVADMGSVV